MFNYLQRRRIKNLISNFFSLISIQMASYLLPLITIPYLIKVIGIEKFGLISFAQALVVYLVVFVDYGFALSATREISVNRENHTKIEKVFNSVMIIKFIFMIIASIFLFTIVLLFDKFTQDALLYLFSFFYLVGEILFPVWFFQGIEQMKYMAILNIIAKLFFTIAIFLFIQEEADYIYVPMYNAIGMVSIGLLSLLYIRKKFFIIFSIPTFDDIKNQLIEGWYLFTSSIYSALYRKSNILILGFFADNSMIGYYSLAEKLVKSLQGLQAPLGQTLYPYLSHKFESISSSKSFSIIFKFTPYVLGLYIIIFFIIFYFSTYIIGFFLNDKESLSFVLLNFRIMLLVFIIGGLNYYYGVLGLIALGYKKEFSNIVMFTGVFNIIVCFCFSYLWNDIGTSIALVSSELFLFTLLIMKMTKLKKRFA
jgi:PST family polysaccharide transporter